MKRSPKRGDASQRAWSVVQEATGQVEATEERVKDAAAVARGRSGGIARSQKLTPQRRREIAQKAVAARKRTSAG